MGGVSGWREGHLVFEPVALKGRKTPIFYVMDQGGTVRLGEIKWYAPWRRYCFFPETGTLYDVECLYTIREFIHARMQER